MLKDLIKINLYMSLTMLLLKRGFIYILYKKFRQSFENFHYLKGKRLMEIEINGITCFKGYGFPKMKYFNVPHVLKRKTNYYVRKEIKKITVI